MERYWNEFVIDDNLPLVDTREDKMTSYSQKEAAICDHLVRLLSKHGGKRFKYLTRSSSKYFDVMCRFQGLHVLIKGKIEDTQGAKKSAYKQAHEPVFLEIAEIVVSLLYPRELTVGPTNKISNKLAKSRLRYRILTETNKNSYWKLGTHESLMEAIRKAQENLVIDDIVRKSDNLVNEEWEGIVNQIEDKSFAVDLYKPNDDARIPKYFAKLRKNILTKDEQSKLKVGSMVNIKISKKLLTELEEVYELDAKLHNSHELSEEAINKAVGELDDLFEGIDWNGGKTPQ